MGEFKAGLMFRESLNEDSGMLFIFDEVNYHSFHMKIQLSLLILLLSTSGVLLKV